MFQVSRSPAQARRSGCWNSTPVSIPMTLPHMKPSPACRTFRCWRSCWMAMTEPPAAATTKCRWTLKWPSPTLAWASPRFWFMKAPRRTTSLNRMATDNLAKQLSASWTYPIDPNSDQIFQQYAAQGQSFFNASGDSDAYVGSAPPPTDDTNITIVGGTTLTTASLGGAWLSETVLELRGITATGGRWWRQHFHSDTHLAARDRYVQQRWVNHLSQPAGRAVALTADNIWVIYGNGLSGSVWRHELCHAALGRLYRPGQPTGRGKQCGDAGLHQSGGLR